MFSGLIFEKEKLKEARLHLHLDGIVKRQCLTTGITFEGICMAYLLNQVNQISLLWGSINEDSDLVTYLNNIFLEDRDGVVFRQMQFFVTFLGAC